MWATAYAIAHFRFKFLHFQPEIRPGSLESKGMFGFGFSLEIFQHFPFQKRNAFGLHCPKHKKTSDKMKKVSWPTAHFEKFCTLPKNKMKTREKKPNQTYPK